MFSKFSKIALVASQLGQFWKILKTLVQLILNSTRPHVITYTKPGYWAIIFFRTRHLLYLMMTIILVDNGRLLGFRWASCPNACGTNQGWWPFCFSVVQIYLVLMQETGMSISATQVPSLQHTNWHVNHTF